MMLRAISVFGQRVLAAQQRPSCLEIVMGGAQAVQWCVGECLFSSSPGLLWQGRPVSHLNTSSLLPSSTSAARPRRLCSSSCALA